MQDETEFLVVSILYFIWKIKKTQRHFYSDLGNLSDSVFSRFPLKIFKNCFALL